MTLVVLVVLAGLLAQAGIAFGAEPEPSYLSAFGPDGTESSEFEAVGPVAVDQGTGAVYVGDVGKQVVYKFDSAGKPAAFGGLAPYLTGNEITGLSLEGFNRRNQIAVDGETHVIYVTSGNKVRAFEANGEPHQFTAGPGEGTSEIPGATELSGVAVDANGNIYASDHSAGVRKVRIYSRAGALITEFVLDSGISPENLAVDSIGNVYVVGAFIGTQKVYKFAPSSFPVAPSTTYSNEGRLEIDEEHEVVHNVAVDPTNDFVYVGEFFLGGEGIPDHGLIVVYDEHGNRVGTLGSLGQGGEFSGPVSGTAVYGAGRRAYGSDREGPDHVKIYESFAIPVLPPTISATSINGLTSTSAILRAKINPNTLDTTYWFEYGLSDCASGEGVCTAIPLGGADIGSGHAPVTVTQAVTGLSPATTYYYRVVAKNALNVTKGPTRTFRTQISGFGFELSDGRVWEQVTPPQKFGGSVSNSGVVQAAADGKGIVFASSGSIVAEPTGNRAGEGAAVLARRRDGSWQTEDLTPEHTKATPLGFGTEYKVFNPDLGRAVLEPRDETPLSREASERTPYLRYNTTPPGYRPLVTSKEGFANVPPGTEFGGEVNGAKNPVALEAANGDLTDLVLSSEAPLLPGAPERALYLWRDGTLSPVSELPAAEGGGMIPAVPGSGTISVRHAVSENGSRVFWGFPRTGVASLDLNGLYLRDTAAEVTTRLDVVQAGASGAGTAHPVFMGASVDGRVVYFTDSQQLTLDANPAGRDLYRCVVGRIGGSLGCVELTDLSASTPGTESAEVKELDAGMSEDGSVVYFVARGLLDSSPNEDGEAAQAKAPNLYVWHEGDGVRFVATLSKDDGADWGQPGNLTVSQASRLSAFSSPSGRYLTFMSDLNLSGDESRDPETGEPTEQVFLYDGVARRLRCVSCDPNGATDLAHRIAAESTEGGLVFPDNQGLWEGRFVGATLPESREGEATVGYSFFQPRAVLDNGRVFYNSVAPLVPVDSNGTWDVYQYEPLGMGSCGSFSGSGSVARSGDGCVDLISSGTDSRPSVLLDASESGDDLFFVTFARLSALDTDNIVDVYDARVGGVAAVAEGRRECQGEACQSGESAPVDSPPASAVFHGAGNSRSKTGRRCARNKRKVRRKGRVVCVKRRHPRARHHVGRGAGK